MSTTHQINDTGTGTDVAAADRVFGYDTSTKTPVSWRIDQIARGGGLTATSDATAGNRTVTAAEILGGITVRDPAGAGRTDTLPTAALLVAAMTNPQVGDVIKWYVVNGADAAEAITIAAGSGGAFDANQTAGSRVIAQNASKLIHIRLTNVTASSEAYVIYC